MARVSCNLLLNKADRQSLLVRLGVDVSNSETYRKRLEKAQAAAANAAGANASGAGEVEAEMLDGEDEDEAASDANGSADRASEDGDV
jgi:hypothetical protein